MADETKISAFTEWYGRLPLHGRSPAKGTISGGIVVIERLKTNFALDIESHTAKGGSQVIGVSGEASKKILERFGEVRDFVSMGGRTNRGLRGDIKAMLEAIKNSPVAKMPHADRVEALEEMQLFLVERIREFHNRQRLKFIFDSSKSTRQSIRDLLAVARETKKEGPVAQYLVGAKLQLRFPQEQIENKSYSTADVQLKRAGDFFVGNTAFHVTIAPMSLVFDKCKKNVEDGLRACLLVPDSSLEGARQNAEFACPGKISVESIESFIGQNIEELSIFSSELMPRQILKLLQIYNERVDAIEIDKSMMIEIPPQLQKLLKNKSK